MGDNNIDIIYETEQKAKNNKKKIECEIIFCFLFTFMASVNRLNEVQLNDNNIVSFMLFPKNSI